MTWFHHLTRSKTNWFGSSDLQTEYLLEPGSQWNHAAFVKSSSFYFLGLAKFCGFDMVLIMNIFHGLVSFSRHISWWYFFFRLDILERPFFSVMKSGNKPNASEFGWNMLKPFWDTLHWGSLGVSKNRDTPKSSILIGFSILNHPFLGTPIFGNTQIFLKLLFLWCQQVFDLVIFIRPFKISKPSRGYLKVGFSKWLTEWTPWNQLEETPHVVNLCTRTFSENVTTIISDCTDLSFKNTSLEVSGWKTYQLPYGWIWLKYIITRGSDQTIWSLQ